MELVLLVKELDFYGPEVDMVTGRGAGAWLVRWRTGICVDRVHSAPFFFRDFGRPACGRALSIVTLNLSLLRSTHVCVWCLSLCW